MSTTYTTNYHLGKQEDTNDNFNMSVITDDMDIIDNVLYNKADKSTTYTKTEVDTVLSSKADASDIPTVPITTIQKNGTSITPVSGTVNITVPTIASDVSALPNTTKYAKALSFTINSSIFVVTAQLKDQNGDNLGTAQTIDLPLESVVVNGAYNDTTKKIILTLQNGNTVEFSVADLVAGLQTELSASNKLNPAFINYDSTHRAVSDTEKATWNGKQSALSSAQLNAVNSGINTTKVEQISANQAEIARLVDDKSKNVLNITKQSVKTENTAGTWNGDTYTRNGMNITINDDMTFTVDGEATGNFSFPLKSTGLTGLQGYVLSGGNPNSSTVSMLFQMKETPWTNLAQDFGTGVTIAQYDDAKSVAVSIYFSNGATADNLVIKPMICTQNSWNFSHEFVPYAPSNAELYRMFLASQS